MHKLSGQASNKTFEISEVKSFKSNLIQEEAKNEVSTDMEGSKSKKDMTELNSDSDDENIIYIPVE